MNPESYLCLGLLVSGGLGFGGLRLWIAYQNRLAENCARRIYEGLDKPRQTSLPDTPDGNPVQIRISASLEFKSLVGDYNRQRFWKLAANSKDQTGANLGVLVFGRMVKAEHFKDEDNNQ